jgi:threonine/homoserine/homoserine lactone efflux protein
LLQSFPEGMVIGLSIAAPVGPIGLLCIQRTLAKGRASGLASGLGAASADALYGGIAGFGITSVSGFLVTQQLWIRLLGGLFLILLGVRVFLRVPLSRAEVTGGLNLGGDYASTLGLTLSNPLTIVSFAAVFVGLGLVGSSGDFASATLLVLGVFAGSALWWLVLSTTVGAIKGRLRPLHLRWINRLSGAMIVCYGLIAILSLAV